MTYQNYRLCHGCRHTYTNQGQELNGIFYCTSCASIRSNNRQSIARRAENTPNRTVSIDSHSLNPSPTSSLLGSRGNTTQHSNTHNSIQAQSSFYSKLFSFLQKHPLITTITIIITIFTIVSIVQVNKENVTFLFVTHSTETAISFCERGIVMNKGKMIFDGPVEEAAECYKEFLAERERKIKARRIMK